MIKISGSISWFFIELLSRVQRQQRKMWKLSLFFVAVLLAVATLPFSEKVLSRPVE